MAVQASMPPRRGIRTSISTMSGSSVGGLVDRLRAVARLADDLDVLLLAEHHLQAAAEQRVVVDDQDADRLACGRCGPRRLAAGLSTAGHGLKSAHRLAVHLAEFTISGHCVDGALGPMFGRTRELIAR